MALQVQPGLLTSRAVGERNVVVRNVVEKVDLLLLEEKTSSNRVDWSIAPSLVEEAAVLIKGIEVVGICLRSEPVQVTNFEVGPLERVSNGLYKFMAGHLPYGNGYKSRHHHHLSIP
jgi:hypothetical protein